MIKINEFYLEDIKNEIHPTSFLEDKNYCILILRFFWLENEEIMLKNQNFVIYSENFFIYNQKTNYFNKLKNKNEFYQILDEKINQILKISYDFLDKIEDIEELIYADKISKNFSKTWFSYKNKLTKMQRATQKLKETFELFFKSFIKKESQEEISFKDLQEHIERTLRNISHSLEILDTLYSFHITTNDEKMNKTIYFLTIFSSIFLPLNLIVGFFGMNTTDLPFTSEKNGTLLASLILVVFGIFTFFIVFLIKRKIYK